MLLLNLCLLHKAFLVMFSTSVHLPHCTNSTYPSEVKHRGYRVVNVITEKKILKEVEAVDI